MDKDDLLNIKPKKNIRKPLIYGAIAFLLFIIAVIAYAIYSNSKEENVVLPPQVNETPKEKTSNTEFKEVPIIEDNTTSLSQKLIKNSEKNTTVENKTIEKKPIENKETEIVNKSVEPVKSVKQVVKAENKKPKVNKSKEVSKIKYYIQVAALMKYKKPNKKFLNLIKKEGFNYTFYRTYIVKNNQKIPITKILIGPFDSEAVARAKLKIVKEKITQNAFIFKVK
jgi:DedD protein